MLYTVANNLQEIINLNTDPKTKAIMSSYGNSNNQIAAAKILKVWLMQLMADTWGGIPYSEAFKLKEGKVYAKYDDLNTLYATFLSELTEAVNMIEEGEDVFTSGDVIYGGDASKWKKFGNSLKMRVALRLSKVDTKWKTYIAEALASGVFTSNDDNAMFWYIKEDPNQSYFYRGYFVDGRNDFSIAKPFMDLLKGQRDTLNNKAHPWEGVVDPRLAIYTNSRSGKYVGIPYGIKSSEMNSTIRGAAPDLKVAPQFNATAVPLVLQPNFAVPYMTYAEVCFIKCEYENFSQAEYEKGVRASIEFWNDLNVEIKGAASVSDAAISSYVDAVNDVVNAETVAIQKYLHLYMYGTEAWAEYRRTGYPTQLLKPNEISYVYKGATLKFEPLSETKGDLPARVKYPTNESTLNGANFNAAVAKLQDGTNNYYSKMFWDVRTATNQHPANK
jgi:hypothetical protein